jgi:hypothetical protein
MRRGDFARGAPNSQYEYLITNILRMYFFLSPGRHKTGQDKNFSQGCLYSGLFFASARE